MNSYQSYQNEEQQYYQYYMQYPKYFIPLNTLVKYENADGK